MSHPFVMLGDMHDEHDDDHVSPENLEQLARSLTTNGALGRLDALKVAGVLREVAARRRHPSGRLSAGLYVPHD